MSVKLLGVVGAGQMGNGIAQVAATKGMQVVMQDIAEASLQKGLATIDSSCERLIKKNLMTADEKKTVLSRIKTSKDMSALKDCDVVIEAASENVDLKLKIFRDLDQAVKPAALLCSNTSSISITKIASVTKRPDK